MYGTIVYLSVLLNFVVSYEVTPLTPPLYVHPYSLHYNVPTNNIYFSDLMAKTINRFDLNENRSYSASLEKGIAPTVVIPIEGYSDRFVVSNNHTITIVQWNGVDPIARFIQDIFTVETDQKYMTNNWNAIKVAPNCQLYGGTFRKELCSGMPGDIAALYKYSSSCGVKTLANGFKAAGGLEWNIYDNLFYYLNICDLSLLEFDWNPHTGDISNGRIVYKFANASDGNFGPLGLTIDKRGNLYASGYFSSSVFKIDPRTSQLLETIEIPAEAVANVAFGGLNLDILFVSTDKAPFDFTTGGISTKIISPLSGSIFMVTGLGETGYPARPACSSTFYSKKHC